MMKLRPCLNVQFLLLLNSLWGCSGVLGPGDHSLIGGRRENPTCLPQCYCTGQSVECDSWPGRDLELLPKTTTALLIKNYPDKAFNTSILGYIQDIQWLRLSPGRLEHFPDVSRLTKLSFLDVSENQIEALPSKPMQNLKWLSHLNVSSNRLKVINHDFLLGLDSLRVLDMSNNPLLEEIPNNLLASTIEISYLDLSYTNLTEIPRALLRMPNLYYLNLSYNSLGTIPEMNQPLLHMLDISHNPLASLPKINQMESLRKLHAHHTNIAKLEESTFSRCHNLQLLDAGASNLTNLDGSPFRNCKKLEELNFSSSLHLWRIEEETFRGLGNLLKLYLNNCPSLYELERDIMNHLSGLKELYLQNSGLEVLPSSLQNLSNLTVLNLKNTMLRCNCNAFWLPKWLNTVNSSQWEGVNPVVCKDGKERRKEELREHLQRLECMEVEVISPHNEWVLAPWGKSALLDCNATGSPTPNIIWQTSQHLLLVHSKVWSEEWAGHQIKEALSMAHVTTDGKYQVLQSGKLLIKRVQREDIGRYKCFAYNAISNASAVTFLGLQDTQFRAFIQESILFGFLCAALFLFITLLIQFIKYLMDRLGCECCCCRNRLSPKAKQIRQLLESVEAYKSAQLDKLRENYNSQVVYIKESCYQQMERIRESYAQQSKNLRDLRDYSTQQLSGARDQYVDQVNKVRDYSLGQMNRVRENYVFQRQRIRKFSAHQLLKLRETYKYQQKTLNKLLETLPDFYIQNCRTGSCQRTDSILFDELDGLDVYYKIDFLDNISTSDYYTPSSTLTRQPKANKCHSRNLSTTSGGTEYLETHSWIVRQESIKSDKINPIKVKLHERSLSLATPPASIHRPDPLRGHKRSLSASHPSPQAFHPKPALMEEPVSPSPSPVSSPLSQSHMPTPLYTPLPSPEHKPNCTISLGVDVQEASELKSPSDVCTLSEVLSDSNESINKTEGTNLLDCDTEFSQSDKQNDPETASNINSPSIAYETSL